MNKFGERRKATPFNQNPKFSIGIDLGSNTLRVVKRDCRSGEFVAEYEKIVRTADGLQQSGRISEAVVERIVQALKEARECVGFEGAALRAVTTEAMRRAENREAVLKRIEEETGVRFEIIEGSEEASLTLLAVEGRLKALHAANNSFVLVDIGGGSTELIFRYPGKTLSRSFPLGIVTLSQEAGSLEKVGELLPEKLPPLREFVERVYGRYGRVQSFVATAGTPTTVAALKLGMNYRTYDAKRINGTRLQREELAIYLRKLLAMNKAEREKAVGVGRDDLIAAGILIFEALFDLLGFEECIVIDDGLREGVAISLCD
ncbi:phosphatase [Nitratifractor sp.]|uniref:Ppx/GppA phosphatase family protein n=1 Tax=Nitratifractor sp. TaxID=2268144 RepID=UPI0025E5C4AE|nr:phosphatase [Nitratifractor sp.]